MCRLMQRRDVSQRWIITISKHAFRWEVLGATQVCQGQGISFPAIMKTSRGLHKVAQEQVQRTGAALVCYRGINMQASVNQLFAVPINLMRGNVFLHALHLTQAQVISGRQIELRFVT